MDENRPLGPSLPWTRINAGRWDVIVVGAGPAGAMAAIVSARQGLRTLLVDRGSFPRDKVCGGCLNGAALGELAAVGLGDLPSSLKGPRLRRFRLGVMGAEVRLDLPAGISVSRTQFDAALVREAMAAGAEFLPETLAADAGLLRDGRRVSLRRKDKSGLAEARWIVAADGLAGGYSGSLPELSVQQAGETYIGLAAETLIDTGYEAGTIHMACDAAGYAGLVSHEDGRLHIAAAASTRWLKTCRSPGAAVARILESNRWPVPRELASSRFQGTPRLRTRRRPVAAARVFLVGDAAGYVEPFTGEGMAWALGGGRAAALRLPAAIAGTEPGKEALDWDQTYRELIGSRQRWCRWSTDLLRRPAWTRMGVRLLAMAPGLANPMIRAINRPWEDIPLMTEAGS
jgi:flavin-dependent dehydrogenase